LTAAFWEGARAAQPGVGTLSENYWEHFERNTYWKKNGNIIERTPCIFGKYLAPKLKVMLLIE
jgi:hypothetical protein